MFSCVLPIGSRRITIDNYVMVKTADGWKHEHRLVMAEHLGRPLLRTEYVHHKNEKNTLDNRIDNLEIMSCGQHNTHHHLGSIHSVETKRRMSIAQIGNKNGKGHHHTTETKRRMSLAKIGNKHGEGGKGRTHTLETKRKISLAKKDYYLQLRFPGL